MRSRCWGGVFEPIEPPVEKPETPTTPPSTKDLITIKIEDDIMAVVGTNTWNAIAYGNGKYVAVGNSGYITTSTDGVNWTTPVQRITASGSTVAGCIFANGMFYIAGSQNARHAKDTVTAVMIWKSSDGETWTGAMMPQASSVDRYSNSIFYANNIFVVGCSQRYIMTSDDNFSSCSFSFIEDANNQLWKRTTYGSGKFVTVGSTGVVAVSTDNGETWNKYTTEAGSLHSIAYGNGKFVAVGNDAILYSENGSTWTKKSLTGFIPCNIVYLDNMFVILGQNGCIMTSKDGISWSNPIRIKNESGTDVTDHLYGIIAV